MRTIRTEESSKMLRCHSTYGANPSRAREQAYDQLTRLNNFNQTPYLSAFLLEPRSSSNVTSSYAPSRSRLGLVRAIINTISFVTLCFIVACSGSKKSDTSHQIHETVKTADAQKSLFFTGNMQPLRETAIISPTNASVESMAYQYGQIVPKDAEIMTLNTPELQKRFNETLTEYLKAKDNYHVMQSKFSGTQELWEAGIISKNNYLSEKSGLNTARISFMQAQQKLDTVLTLSDQQKTQNLTRLNLTDFKQIKQVLENQTQQIHLKAPFEGMLLYPPKSLENKDERISVGSALKSSQLIALIGDLSGLHIEIHIPETDIDKVHPGMSAIIRSPALGEMTLRGEVLAVNAQAASSQNGLPSFTALVEVKKLSKAEQTRIKIGLSANVELRENQSNQLMVPIRAVHMRNNKTYITILDAKNQKEERLITTGRADAARVTVLEGLKAGEVIAYDA